MRLGIGSQGADDLVLVSQGMDEEADDKRPAQMRLGAGGLSASICSAVIWKREQTVDSRGSGMAAGRFREAGSCDPRTFLQAPDAASARACV